MIIIDLQIKRPKKESAVDIVVNCISDQLFLGHFSPGDRIPSETELAEALSVSRGSVREGMKVLKTLGMVEIKPGDGTYIANANNSKNQSNAFTPLMFSFLIFAPDSKQLTDFRDCIQLSIIHSNIQSYQEDKSCCAPIYDSIKELELLLHHDAPSLEIAQNDVDFHYALACSTTNGLMMRTYRFVINFIRGMIIQSYQDNPDYCKITLDYHRAILSAIETGDLSKSYNPIVLSPIRQNNKTHQNEDYF